MIFRRTRFFALIGSPLGRLWRGAAIGGLFAGVVWGQAGTGLVQLVPFELDGNARIDGQKADWQNVVGSLQYSGIAQDFSNFSGGSTVTDPTTFIQGSKDTQDTGAWNWNVGGIPPKDDITNAYAAAYFACPQGASCPPTAKHMIIVFGADRFANNGAAQMGFWFLQNGVTADTPKTFTGGPHADNDILVLANFTTGGTVANVAVYKWSNGGLVLVNGNSGDCSSPNATDACAISNQGASVDLFWPSHFKFPVVPDGKACDGVSAGTCAPPVSFFEGAIDITSLLNGVTPCVQSFMSETRSSPSISASLEDFLIHKFSICGIDLTNACAPKTGNSVNADGSVRYHWDNTVTNTGVGTVYGVSFTDTLPTGPAPTNVKYYDGGCVVGSCSGGTSSPPVYSTLDPGASKTWSVEFDRLFLNATNTTQAAASINVGGTPGSCGPPAADGTVCSASKADTCSAEVVNTVTITKFCGIPVGYPGNTGQGAVAIPGTQLFNNGSTAAVQVNFRGKVCNTGQEVLTVPAASSIIDVPGATISTVALPVDLAVPGQNVTTDCIQFSGYYTPSGSSVSGLGLGAGRYSFSDEVFVKGVTAKLGAAPAVKSACTGLPGAPSDAQNCAPTTCNICFGDPTSNGGIGLCTPAN